MSERTEELLAELLVEVRRQTYLLEVQHVVLREQLNLDMGWVRDKVLMNDKLRQGHR